MTDYHHAPTSPPLPWAIDRISDHSIDPSEFAARAFRDRDDCPLRTAISTTQTPYHYHDAISLAMYEPETQLPGGAVGFSVTPAGLTRAMEAVYGPLPETADPPPFTNDRDRERAILATNVYLVGSETDHYHIRTATHARYKPMYDRLVTPDQLPIPFVRGYKEVVDAIAKHISAAVYGD